jgi:hypothetical protein
MSPSDGDGTSDWQLFAFNTAPGTLLLLPVVKSAVNRKPGSQAWPRACENAAAISRSNAYQH